MRPATFADSPEVDPSAKSRVSTTQCSSKRAVLVALLTTLGLYRT